MPTDHRAKLATIKHFDQLIAYLRDEMGWPIGLDSFEDVDDLFYEFTADELGIDPQTAAKIQEIKRLRPLSPKQPWGIFFVKFEPKRLPVVALRRILGQVALKKRASANNAERAAWAADDLLFVSNYGEGDERQISFAHFARPQDGHDLPTLKVLGWDNRDTALHLDDVARELTAHLAWPGDDADAEAWRARWRAAFTLGHREVVTTSKGLSIRLAELARAIRDRIQAALAIETDKGPLTKLLTAFQTALVHDLDADGFADMYAQTIAYGLLSARIADPHKKTADDFAAHMRTNPFLRELMETFLKVGGRRGTAGGPGIDFDELGISEVVDLLDAANMEAVVRDFGDRNRDEDPVMHFYELFLHYYDKQLKIQRGVFYTPQPVVSYIVRSIHELLQTEFGLADGLADTTTWGEMLKKHAGLKLPPLTDEPGEKRTIPPDEPFVQILDPATGTATFLVEVIDVIHRTLVAKWKQQRLTDSQQRAAWNDYVPRHLLPRLHAFELMMAPYAIAHMKIGLKLAETGYRFGTEERARIYLTNALEPWVKQLPLIGFDALAHEAEEVNKIKKDKRFTVIIGNPPYSGHSANNDVQWIVSRVHDYTKEFPDLQKPGQGKWLQDDYVKFYRLAAHLIASAGAGAMGFITNNGFLDNATFRGMRKHTSETMPLLSFVDLRGSVMKREKAEDGSQDENVFDIQQSVAISVGALSPLRTAQVAHLDVVGSRAYKYRWLSAHVLSDSGWRTIEPQSPFYLFIPSDDGIYAEYFQFFSIPQLLSQNGDPAPGIVTTHDDFAVSWTKEEQIEKVERLLATKSEKDARQIFRLCTQNQWNYSRAKRELPASAWRGKLVQVLYRPFDLRWTVFDSNVAVHRRERVTGHMLKRKNLALIFMRQVALDDEYSHFGVSRFIADNRAFYSNKGIMFLAPLYLARDSGGDLLTSVAAASTPNLNPQIAHSMAREIGLNYSEQPSGDLCVTMGVEDIFHYAYAVFHSPVYRRRYAEFLKIDFPRLPLIGNLELFRVLAGLGGELTTLHLLESPRLATPTTEFVGGRNPEVEKPSWSRSTVWIDKAQTTGFKGVREDVWSFQIGGYQVCEKWLKDRKGRRLSKDDIAHYQKIIVALAETIRLMKEIDEVIEQHGGWPGAFQTSAAKTGEVKATPAEVVPFRPRAVAPKPAERYVTCVPMVPLKAAAGAFSDPQHIEDDGFEWVAVESRHRLRKGMFVAQVVGKSMEPAIPDGAFCLFRAPVEGTRQGKTVLVQLRDTTDPETGQCFTVKRYDSEKASEGDSWRHERITLKPVNPDFEPIELTAAHEGELRIIAEFLEVVTETISTAESRSTPAADAKSLPEFRLESPAHQPSLLDHPSQEEQAEQVQSNHEDPEATSGRLKATLEDLPCWIRALFNDGRPRDRETAIRELREQLGFDRTGPVLREALDNGLRTAVRRGILTNEGGTLRLGPASIGDFDRDFLKEQFLASLSGRAWRDRSEVARGLARHLGFRRTGSNIEDTVRSIINGLLRERRLEARGTEIRRAD